MKKIFVSFASVLILLGVFSSCKKIVSAVFQGTDVNVPEVQVTVPIIPFVAPGEVSLGSYTYRFNLDSAVKANTGGVFGADVVSSIKVKQIKITITNADQLNNLANFESARVTLESNNNTNPVELFSTIFPDTYTPVYIATPTNGPELLSYLKGSEIVYRMYGKNRRITTKPLNMIISVIIRVN